MYGKDAIASDKPNKNKEEQQQENDSMSSAIVYNKLMEHTIHLIHQPLR